MIAIPRAGQPMPQNKSQHFVPKAHMAPFTVNRDGAAIHLLNLRSLTTIENAPTKGQCAKNYLYGEPGDLRLEKILQEVEGRYADTVRNIEGRFGRPSAGDLDILKFFALLQHTRTAMAAARSREGHTLMFEAAMEGVPKEHQLPDPDLSDRTLVQMSMRAALEQRHLVEDLKSVIVVNKSSDQFFTSDDPAIFTNRFYIQKLARADFGFANSGLIMVLPLSPSLLFLSYDGGVYVLPDKCDGVVAVSSTGDIAALNDLQCLHAGANIYFSDWIKRQSICAQFTGVAPRRVAAHSRVQVLMRDAGDVRSECFRTAKPHERASADDKLLHLQVTNPRPNRWLSKLRFRTPIRAFSNGTGAGWVRREEWLRSTERPLAGQDFSPWDDYGYSAPMVR